MQLKHIALLGAAIWAIVFALALVSCQPPDPIPPPPGNDTQTTTVIIGNQPSPTTCQNPDRVDINAPSNFTHGQIEDIALIPSLGGQVQTSNVCPVSWNPPGGPCVIQNPSNLSTTMSAQSSGLCTAQGQVGTTQSAAIAITVN